MGHWEQSKAPWALALGIWCVYGTAALTEGLIVFHPNSRLTSAVFRSFAETVDAAYRGDPFGDNLHRAFALVDTFFAPVFWAAGVGLVRRKRWGLLLAFACALTSCALLTVDLLADAFGGFRNVLNPWAYSLAFLPYYIVVGFVVRYSLRHWAADAGDRAPAEAERMTPPPFSRRSCAFLLDGAIALLLCAFAPAGWLLGVAYLMVRDGLWGGASIGKRMLSLQVIRRDAGAGIGLVDSLRRNVIFAIPLLNAALSAAVFEGVVLYFDEEGLRVGDRLAGTRVIRSVAQR